jgi:hypothetical protein
MEVRGVASEAGGSEARREEGGDDIRRLGGGAGGATDEDFEEVGYARVFLSVLRRTGSC